MKRCIVYAVFMVWLSSNAENGDHFQSLIGKKAPNFTAQAMVDGEIKELSLSDVTAAFKVLVFYPADFSMVCPTELHGFQDILAQLKERDAQVLGISTDNIYSHKAWLEIPKEQAGIQGITYPLVSDITKDISRDYGVLDSSRSVALRAIFIIDKDNIVQVMMVNNLKIGRSADEVIRLIDAIKFTQENPGDVCPLNWKPGQQAMHATPEGAKEYMAGN